MDVDLQACIRGDKSAWDDFVDRWAGVIHAAVGRAFAGRGLDRAEVEDTVQDVFLRLIKQDCRLLRSYDPGRASLSTWLTIVARSAAIDRLRKLRDPAVPLDPQDLPGREPDPGPGPAPAFVVPLSLLTERQRLVLRLLFDEQRSVAEAARIAGVDEQTIRSTKHKALTRLRAHFQAGEADSGDGGPASPVQPPRDP